MSYESPSQAPIAKLSSVLDIDDVPPGMVLRTFSMPSDDPTAPLEVSHWRLSHGADSGDDLHDGRELWLIAAGRGEITAGRASMEVAAGDAILIQPNQPHRLENTGTDPVEVFSVWWSS